MLRSLRKRIHVALNIEPRDELAGFWAVISGLVAAGAAFVYLSNHDHPLALLLALAFANGSLDVLFRPAAGKKRGWRHRSVEVGVALSLHALAGPLYWHYAAGLSVDWDEIEYLMCGALALYLVWQVADRLFLRPRAFDRRRATETVGWYREEFPRL